jgi:predicted GH43/DUF377 family glycosyl hydrolase
MSFLDHLRDDPAVNQRAWRRSPANPVIPYGEPWCGQFVAPSSLLVEEGTLTLYAEGGTADRECIGRYTASAHASPEGGWVADPANPLLEPTAEGFDRGSVFDPAVVRFGTEVHLYYSATRGGAHAFAERVGGSVEEAPDDESIGHAVVLDGALRREPQPVLRGRCPFVVEWRDRLHLFHVQVVAGGYRIFGATSSDGQTFETSSPEPLLDVGLPGEWDSFTVTTPKIIREEGRFVMLYAGDDRQLDDPTGIGVATSEDLVHWTKHPGNPILRPGPSGGFDGCSVASAIPVLVEDRWHLLYAGASAPVSTGLNSQIGLARWEGA